MPGYYFTDIQYETDPGKGTTNALSFISHDEGRVIPDPQSGRLTYEYHYRDHLGNLRVSFRQQSQQNTTARLSMEPPLARSEEAAFRKVSENRTAGPAHSGNYAARLQQESGPGKTVKLQPGETIKASVFGYVEQSRKRRTAWLPVPIIGDEPTVVDGKLRRKTVIRGGIAIPIKSGKKQGEVPDAFLQLVAKDTSGKIVSLQTARLGKASVGGWQELQLVYQAKTDETVEVSLVNSSARVSALFDDLVLTTEPPLIVQENHYDPWGLNLAGIEVTGNPEHKWQFNGQEKQTEFGLNWQSYRFRDYDPQTARFMRPDPIGEKFNDLTLYQFARNNAASNIEIEGLEGAQKALLDEMQMYESIFKGTGEKVIDRLRSFSNTLREFTSNLASLPEQNIIIYGSGGLSGYIEMGKDTPGKGKYATIDLGKGNDIMFMIELYKPEEIETFTGGANDIWDLVLANDDPINQRFGWDGHYYNHHRKYRKSVIYDDVQIEGQDIYADNDSRNIPKDKDGNEMFYVVSIPTTNEDGATSYKLHRFSPQGLEALLNMGKRENEKIERQKNIVR